MNAELADVALVVGRLLLGGIFVFGGIEHYFVAKPVLGIMGRRGVPMPLAVLIVGSVFQAALGLMLMLGVYVAWASLGLVVFTIAATLMFLHFWDMEGAERVAAQNNATVNVGVIGGLLVLAAEALR